MSYDYLLKIITVGDFGVGKKALVDTYADGCFTTSMIRGTSIPGDEFRTRRVNINNKMIKHQLFKTCSQEKFGKLSPAYYRRAHICVLVFDLTNLKSFENACNFWIDDINENTNCCEIIVVGTKSDLIERKVPQEQINDFCNKYSLPYFEVSAKKYETLQNIFHDATLKAIEKIGINVQKSTSRNKCF